MGSVTLHCFGPGNQSTRWDFSKGQGDAISGWEMCCDDVQDRRDAQVQWSQLVRSSMKHLAIGDSGSPTHFDSFRLTETY